MKAPGNSRISKITLLLTVAFAGAIVIFQNCGTPMPVKSRGYFSTSSSADQSASPSPTPFPSTGPLDGKYSLAGWTCGTNDIFTQAQTLSAIRSITLVIGGVDAKVTTAYFNSCAMNVDFNYGYGVSGIIATSQGVTTCSACSSAQCRGMGAPNPPITSNYSYSVSGSTMTFMRILSAVEINDLTLFYKAAGCTVGNQEVLVYVRQ